MKYLKIRIVSFLAILAALVPGSAWPAGPSLSVDTFSVNFSTPTERSLDLGYIDVGDNMNSFAVRINIYGGDMGQRWKLYVRAVNDIFSPGIYNKKCNDLRWKFDADSPSAYRRLRTSNQLVASGSGGQNVTKTIDLRMMLGWSDPPARYSLPMAFTLMVE